MWTGGRGGEGARARGRHSTCAQPVQVMCYCSSASQVSGRMRWRARRRGAGRHEGAADVRTGSCSNTVAYFRGLHPIGVLKKIGGTPLIFSILPSCNVAVNQPY